MVVDLLSERRPPSCTGCCSSVDVYQLIILSIGSAAPIAELSLSDDVSEMHVDNTSLKVMTWPKQLRLGSTLRFTEDLTVLLLSEAEPFQSRNVLGL